MSCLRSLFFLVRSDCLSDDDLIIPEHLIYLPSDVACSVEAEVPAEVG